MPLLCTYFDINYLPRGLALHESLVRHWTDFRLIVLCLDAETERVLRTLSLPGVELLTLEELEAFDPALPAVKSTRSLVGYYLTCTPVLLRYALQRAEAAIYLDADLYFFSSPQPVLDEFAAGSIYVHEHRPDHADWDPTGGRFNVGLVAMRNDPQGRACAELWRSRCLDWCEHERVDGRFGDQKYLDEWPARFDKLVVSRHRGVGAGPWNLGDLSYSQGPAGDLMVDGQPLVFFHFTRLTRMSPHVVRTFAATYCPHVPALVRRKIYRMYIRSLQVQVHRLRGMNFTIDGPFGRLPYADVAAWRSGHLSATSQWRRAISLLRGLRSGELMLSSRHLAVGISSLMSLVA